MSLPAVLFAAVVATCTSGAALAADLQLLMVEQPGCIHCARWHAEVGPEYAITDEGRAAPLRPVQLRDGAPEGVTLTRPAVFTPTFVMLVDGVETGRIEGYPGEDFFWPMLAAMIAAAQADAGN